MGAEGRAQKGMNNQNEQFSRVGNREHQVIFICKRNRGTSSLEADSTRVAEIFHLGQG